MTAEGKEIAVHRLHIHLEMGCALGTVHQDGNAVLMCNFHDFIDRIHRSQHIAHMGHAD